MKRLHLSRPWSAKVGNSADKGAHGAWVFGVVEMEMRWLVIQNSLMLLMKKVGSCLKTSE